MLLPDGTEEVLSDIERWTRFDACCLSCTDTFNGRLHQEYKDLRTKSVETFQKMPTGRQAFWLILKDALTDDTMHRTYNLQSLSQFGWFGDSRGGGGEGRGVTGSRDEG